MRCNQCQREILTRPVSSGDLQFCSETCYYGAMLLSGARPADWMLPKPD